MFCSNCGNKMEDGVRFCSQCGAAVTPPVSEEPKTEAPAVEAPKAQMPDWMHDNWVPEMPVIEAPAPKGRKKKQAPSAQAPASPTVAPASPTVPPADPFAVPSREQETKKPKKAKKKRTGLRVVAALLIVAILAGIGGWVLLTYETVYVVTSVRSYNQEGVNIELTTYEYDSKGRLEKKEKDHGEGTEVWDDALGVNTIEFGEIDGIVEREETYKYDQEGRLTETYIRYSDNKKEIIKYRYRKKNASVTEMQVDYNYGAETTYTLHYNARKQLTKVCYEDTKGEEQTSVSFRYDGKGRLKEYVYHVLEGWYKTEYSYEKNRLVQIATYSKALEEQPWGAYQTVCEYEYDEQGRLVCVQNNGSTGNMYDYDHRGNLVAITDRDGNETKLDYSGRKITGGEYTQNTGYGTEDCTYEYDKHGNLIEITYKNGDREIYEYKRMWLTKENANHYFRRMYESMTGRYFALSLLYGAYHYLVPMPANPEWKAMRLTESLHW